MFAFDTTISLKASPLFQDVLKFIKAAVKLRSDIFFLWVIPKAHEGIINDSCLDDVRDRVRFIVVDYYRRNILESFFVRLEWGQLFGQNSDFVYDLVLTNRFVTVYHLKRVFEAGVMESYRVDVPWVLWTWWGPMILEQFPIRVGDLIVMFANLLAGCWLVFTSIEKPMVIEFLKKYFSPWSVNEILKRTRFLDVVIGTDVIDGVPREEQQKVGLFWGGRPCAQKRWQEIVKLYERIFQLRDIRVVFSFPGEAPQEVKGVKWATVYENVDHFRFIQEVRRNDIFVCLSQYEFPGIAYLEMLYAGLVGVYKRERWVEYLMPDYPFVCNSIAEVERMVLWVIDNIDEARRRLVGIREWIRDRFSPEVGALRRLQFFDEIVDKARQERRFSGSFVELIERVSVDIKKGEEITMAELLERIKRVADSQEAVDRFITKFFVREVMFKLGFRDKCDSGEVVFQKL